MGVGDEGQLLDGIPAGELASFLAWRERVRGTNISDRTLLATDYLNHFNEIVMLIEMVPDMPEILEDCTSWQPKSYVQHFRDSGFADKELAIEAYAHVPSKFRGPLEDLVARLETVVAYTLMKLWLSREDNPHADNRSEVGQATAVLHSIIQAINGIIHGSAHAMIQDEVDAYLSGHEG